MLVVIITIFLTIIMIIGMFIQKDKKPILTHWTIGVILNILLILTDVKQPVSRIQISDIHTNNRYWVYNYELNILVLSVALFSILILTVIYFAQINNLNDKKINGQ